MAKLRKQKNICQGSQSYDYRKTGAGSLPADPSTTPSGAALTLVANRTLALAGTNDKVHGFFRLYDKGADKISIFGEDAGEISGIPANGTIAVGSAVIGYLDSDRGKVKAVDTTALAQVANGKWDCTQSVSGSCSLRPSA